MMDDSMETLCSKLDDFLDDALSGDERAAFDAHLEACGVCRDAVMQQRWIDRTLRAQAAATPAPAALLTATSREFARQGRRQWTQRALAGGLAAAASIALLAVWQRDTPPLAPGSARGSLPTPHNVAQRDATPGQSLGLENTHAPPTGQASTASVATFTAGGDGIAVPIASDSPDVTIVQFYTTTEAERRHERQRSIAAKYQALIGG